MFPFFLDDDMMDYIQPNKMFDIVVTKSCGPNVDGKIDLQLIEVDTNDIQCSGGDYTTFPADKLRNAASTGKEASE